MTQKPPRRVSLATAGLLIGMIAMPDSSARADTFIFNDLTESPTLTHIGTATTVQVTCSGSEDCTITLSRPGQALIDISPNIPPDGLNFAEDPQLQFFSDQIAVTPENDMIPAASAMISFLSDSLLEREPCSDFVGGCQLQETGQLQGGSITWGNPINGMVAGFDDILIQSDVEVPEPSSWLLLVTGLLGLLAFGSRGRGLAA